MKSKHDSIGYVFEPMSNGGRVRITTTDADALKAVHQFLTFKSTIIGPNHTCQADFRRCGEKDKGTRIASIRNQRFRTVSEEGD